MQWPGGWGGRNVTLKEILPVLAWGILGHLWVGLSVVTHVDNEAAVAFLNYGQCCRDISRLTIYRD